MTKKQLRYVHLIGATGEIRTAMFDGVEHVVLPVVAMVEGVIQPSNSEIPELVLASELEHAPGGWNGSPVLVDHPQINGEPVSANIPEVLERSAFGIVFGARLDGKKLKMEAYLNPAKASEVGEVALEMMKRISDGETIEVSIGAFIIAESASGNHNGKEYKAIWREIVPDHLALLSIGSVGACSVEMGCGTPRTAVYKVTEEGLELQEDTMPEPQEEQSWLRTMASKLRNMLRTSAEHEESDAELRDLLDRALRGSDASFAFIEAVFPGDKNVVYAVFSAVDGGGIQFFQRSYKLSAEGSVTLADEKIEVRPVTRFEAMSGEATCSCGRSLSSPKGNKMKSDAVDRLISDSKSPWDEADREWLNQVPEARTEAFSALPPPAADPVTPVADPVTPVADPVTPVVDPVTPVTDPVTPAGASAPVTAEAYVASAPEPIREILSAGLKANQDKKAAIIVALKASNRCQFTDEQLAEKPIAELEMLASLANVPDFSSTALPRVETPAPEEVPTAPTIASKLQAKAS